MTIQSDITNLFSGLTTTMTSVREVQKLYNPKVAFAFNSFNFLKPNENKFSEILAYFLDPDQGHGQGATFLNLFLQKFGLNEKVGPYEIVEVRCEAQAIDRRRIDILLCFDGGSYAVGVENKIWAGDQHKQLEDYNSFLKGRYEDNYNLIYLNPYGANPSEASVSVDLFETLIESKHLRVASYEKDLIELIHEWGKHCEADRVRVFLQDFEQYLKQEISGERFMQEHVITANFILNSKANIEAAFHVQNAMNNVKQQLFLHLKSDLKERAEKGGWILEMDDDLQNIYAIINFRKANWKYAQIGFEFQSSGCRKLISGVHGIKGTSMDLNMRETLQGKLSDRFTQSSPYWPSFRYFGNYTNWGTDEFLAIHDKKMANVIFAEVIEIEERLKGVIL